MEIIKSPEFGDEVMLVSPLLDKSFIGPGDVSPSHDINKQGGDTGLGLPDAYDEGQQLTKNTTLDILDIQELEHAEANILDQLETLKEQARSSGYADGYAQGEADAQLSYVEVSDILKNILDTTQASASNMLQDAELVIGFIVFEAVSKILGDKLVTSQGCKEVVHQVIKGIQKESILTVKVSPKDLKVLQYIEDSDSTSAPFGLPLEADDSIGVGGCVVKLKDGLIDGRIETQLSVFIQSLKEVMSYGHHS